MVTVSVSVAVVVFPVHAAGTKAQNNINNTKVVFFINLLVGLYVVENETMCLETNYFITRFIFVMLQTWYSRLGIRCLYQLHRKTGCCHITEYHPSYFVCHLLPEKCLLTIARSH